MTTINSTQTSIDSRLMHADIQNIDTLIKNAKVFNNGEAAVIEDVAVSDGRIVARGPNLNEANASRVIDAEGMWLMPGLFDIHKIGRAHV